VSHDLSDLILEHLDTGILLADNDSRVLRRNALASQFLSAFGGNAHHVPGALWTQLAPVIASAAAVPSRFTPASPFIAPDRRRFFVRCRQLPVALLFTVAVAALREIDVQRVLAEKFRLSAQEIRIAFFAAQGYRNREIADRLDIVEGTVKNYLTTVFDAMCVRSRTELAGALAQLVEEQP
jgi:DNA-binding CsgD family transcriptional regulator